MVALDDATTLTQSKAMAAYFEEAARASGQAKLASNWVMGEVSRRLNAQDIGIEQAPVSAATLAQLIGRIQDGTVSNNAARQVFDALWTGEGQAVDAVIEAKGLKQMNDSGALEKIVEDVIRKSMVVSRSSLPSAALSGHTTSRGRLSGGASVAVAAESVPSR